MNQEKVANKAVKMILEKLDRGLLILQPDYQRDFVWNLAMQQKLIESILLGFDMPKVYFAIDGKGSKAKIRTIDGQQRITTIHRFVNGSFPLAKDCADVVIGDEVFKTARRRFDQLPQYLQDRIHDYELHALEIDNPTREREVDQFLRLNISRPMTAQEKLDTIPAKLARTVIDLAEHATLVRLFTTRDYRRGVASNTLCSFILGGIASNTDIQKVYVSSAKGQLSDYIVQAESMALVDLLSRLKSLKIVQKTAFTRQVIPTILFALRRFERDTQLEFDTIPDWVGAVNQAYFEYLESDLGALRTTGGRSKTDSIKGGSGNSTGVKNTLAEFIVDAMLAQLNGSRLDAKGVVYILAPTNPDGELLYKIGKTKNPEQRLKQLQTGNAKPFMYVHQIQTNDMARVEAELHAEFAKQRRHGEWFALDESQLAMIETMTHEPLIYPVS